jgi:hypothetical protein
VKKYSQQFMCQGAQVTSRIKVAYGEATDIRFQNEAAPKSWLRAPKKTATLPLRETQADLAGSSPKAVRADPRKEVEERSAFLAGPMFLNARLKKAEPFLVFAFAEA